MCADFCRGILGNVPTSRSKRRKAHGVSLGLDIYHITQMPELICTLELQMWQKSGSEHKPATILGRAGSAGPEDLTVFTPGTRAGASMYTDTCGGIVSNSIANTAFRLSWP